MSNFKLPMKVEDVFDNKDLDYALEIQRWLLVPLGLWPMKNSKYSSILRIFLITVCTFLLTFMIVPHCLLMFFIIKDFRVRLELIGPLSFSIMNICKYFGILLKHQEIQNCIEQISEDWCGIKEASEKKIMLEKIRAARLFTIICASFMYGGGLPFTVILPITRGVTVVENITYRHFAYPSHFIFFNPHTRPNFDVVYSIHCICGFITYTITCGLCSIAIICIMHICGQIKITSGMLQNLVGNFHKKSVEIIVKKHINSLKFASRLENILSGMCFVEITGCTFNICMLGYYFITAFTESEPVALISFFLLFVSFTFNIFMFCYIGDLLTEQCNSLKEAAYMINWYQLSSKDARNIIIIVSSTYHPITLTAGKLVTLSLQSFTNVMKMSVTYLNMLRTFTTNPK